MLEPDATGTDNTENGLRPHVALEDVEYVRQHQRQGVTGEVFFVWNPNDVTNIGRLSFLGRLAELGALEAAGLAGFGFRWASFHDWRVRIQRPPGYWCQGAWI
jgi:hypothetical protein